MTSLFGRRPRIYTRRLILEQLEERIVLDASVAPAAQDHPVDATHVDVPQPADTHTTTASSQPDQGTDHTADSQGTNSASATPVSQPSADPHDNALGTSFQQGNDVILVSSSVPNIDAVKTAASAGTTVVVYDGEHGNLDSVDNTLHDLVQTTGQKIEHLAIVSHGDPGILNLSDSESWSAYTVKSNPASWTALGALLTPDAQIDLYGCDIGKGSDGAALLASVSALTGATVCASDNPTGSGPDHDWTLEVKTGASALPSLLDGANLAKTSISLDDTTVIKNGSFEQGYTGWTLVDNSLISGPYPWLSTWGIVSGGTIAQGSFNDFNNPNNVTHGYNDYADQYGPLWHADQNGAPQLAPGIDHQSFTPLTTITPTGEPNENVAFAAQNYDADMKMYQDITLPAGTKTLSWDMRYHNYWSGGFSDDGAGGNPDQYLSVSLTAASDPTHPLVLAKTANGTYDQTNMDMTHFSVDISSYVAAHAGDTFRLEVDVTAEKTLLVAGFDNFCLNHKPVAYNQDVSAFEDIPMVIALGGNDADPGAGQHLTYFLGATPSSGTVYDYSDTGLTHPLAADAQLTGNKVWYKTALHDYSDTSLTFHVQDDGGGGNDTSDNATVNIHGNVVNGTPVADNIFASGSGPIPIVLSGHDTGQPDATKVSFDVKDYDASTPGIQTQNGGTIEATGVVHKDALGNYTQEWTYTPTTGGNDTFTYTFVTPDGPWQGFDAGHAFGADQLATGFDLAVADLNHDGRPDIIVCNGTWSGGDGYASYFYLANASGGFDPGVQIGTDTHTKAAIDVGDLNGDGYTDLATRNINGAMVYLWHQDSVVPANSKFDPGIPLLNCNFGSFGSIGIGDVNGDGHNDIVVATNSAGTSSGGAIGDILVYKSTNQNGTWGNFSTALPTVIDTYSGYGSTSTACVADVNGDGQPDIVIGKTNTNNIVLLNDGYGNFSAHNDPDHVTVLPLPLDQNGNPQGRNVQYVAVGDVDGNGTRDIVAANDSYPGQTETFYRSETFYRNDGSGNFTAFNIGPTDNTNSGSIRLADVNHDGCLDVLVGNYNGTPSKYYLFDKATIGTDNNPFAAAGVNFGAGVTTFGAYAKDVGSAAGGGGDGFVDWVASSDSGLKNQVFYNLGFADQVSNIATVTITDPPSGAAMSMVASDVVDSGSSSTYAPLTSDTHVASADSFVVTTPATTADLAVIPAASPTVTGTVVSISPVDSGVGVIDTGSNSGLLATDANSVVTPLDPWLKTKQPGTVV